MSNVPARVADRLKSSLKDFQAIVQSAKSRDVNESDTVIIVTDMLSAVFGYDKYSEITSELCIRGTYCDLATKVEGKIQTLVEVKAIGTELKDNHSRQAVDYAAGSGRRVGGPDQWRPVEDIQSDLWKAHRPRANLGF